MTLWQDPPPQTRRQARENERRAAQRESEQSTPSSESDEKNDEPIEAVVPTPSAVAGAGRSDAEDVTEDATPSVDQQFGSGRFGVASRPPMPVYESSFDSLLAPEAPSSDELEDADGSPDDEAESGRSDSIAELFGDAAVEADHADSDVAAPAAVEADRGDSDVAAPPAVEADRADSRATPTVGEAEHPDPDAAAPAAASEQGGAEPSLYRVTPDTGELEPVTRPVSIVPASTDPHSIWNDDFARPSAGPTESDSLAAPERTLTRRELRAMLQAQEANAKATGHGISATEAGSAEPSSAAQRVPSLPVFNLTPAAPVAEQNSEKPPEAEAVDDAGSGGSVEDARAVETSDPADAGEKQPYKPPVGHWSTAGELDEKNQQFDQIISRSVGASGAATTTNALILPSIPTAPNATGPLTATGEILVTGSIDLPRGLGSTGQHPDHFDSSEMDRMFDQAESDLNTSNVAPIRASRAVSGHTSTRGVITPPKKSRGRLPLILSITAGVLLLAVVGLLIAGYVLKVF